MDKVKMYDVNLYSNQELFRILDLNNPTDIELESKLIHYIHKYSMIRNTQGMKLSKFFQEIYERFFEMEEELIEGYANIEEYKMEDAPELKGNAIITDVKINSGDKLSIGNNTITIGNDFSTEGNSYGGYDSKYLQKINNIPYNLSANNNLVSKPNASKPKVQLTSQQDYTEGQLNPILKQTYKRIITIDSQYRDSIATISTDFTLNFTETLKNVVSLKLYAIQLPYTWYTISKGYGSNIFYLKGNSPGINNGNHDYVIDISAGNYNQTSVTEAIQNTFKSLPSKYPDVSFGNTNLVYNITSCFATINVNLQKIYDESYYKFQFLGDYHSPVPINNIFRKYLLSSFLGFNYQNYTTNTVHSQRIITVDIDTVNSKYQFDNSNNNIKIVQYLGPNTYDPVNSKVLFTIDISFSSFGTTKPQSNILSIVNSTIQSNSYLTNSYVTYNLITGTDMCGNKVDNYGNYMFEWTLKLNRYKVPSVENSKTVLIVPDDSQNTKNSIWIGSNSCFRFDSSLNELNNLYSETSISSSSFIIQKNTFFGFKCNDERYNYNGINDMSFSSILPSSNYTLNNYLSAINQGFTQLNNKYYNNGDITNSVFKLGNTFINSSDNNFHLQVDINKTLTTENFFIDSTNGYLLNSCGIELNQQYILNGITNIQNTITIIQLPTYNINDNNNYLMTIYPDSINSSIHGISPDLSYNLYIPNGTYSGYLSLQNIITKTLNTFSDREGSYPLVNSNITIIPTNNGDNSLLFTLHIDIEKILTEKDYIIEFHDPIYDINNDPTETIFKSTSWYINFGLDFSYNLNSYSPSTQNYADINGKKIVLGDTIDLRMGGIGNKIQLVPLTNAEGVYGSGNIIIEIPPNIYSRDQLFTEINRLFDANPITNGTRINYYTNSITNLEYTIIRWNINKIYTAQDYKLVFYDLNAFVSCFLGNSSIRNATWDTTLGWLLGFRSLTEYPLTTTNIYTDLNTKETYYLNPDSLQNTGCLYNCDVKNNITSLTGDTTVNVNTFNYLMVILDDYNTSHLNDGLITITPKDNTVSLPSYADRSKYKCDPVTGQIVNTGITQEATNNLTQNQLYSINQIINRQNTKKSYTNTGVYAADVFALIPIKTAGMKPGDTYVELGGTLQNQDRVYFGPVNIYRMAIQLLNDKGDVLDLNGSNWSLQIICEHIYQNTQSNSGK